MCRLGWALAWPSSLVLAVFIITLWTNAEHRLSFFVVIVPSIGEAHILFSGLGCLWPSCMGWEKGAAYTEDVFFVGRVTSVERPVQLRDLTAL